MARLRIVRIEVTDSLGLFAEPCSTNLQHLIKCRIISRYKILVGLLGFEFSDDASKGYFFESVNVLGLNIQ